MTLFWYTITPATGVIMRTRCVKVMAMVSFSVGLGLGLGVGVDRVRVY